jgi:hypothetical protein
MKHSITLAWLIVGLSVAVSVAFVAPKEAKSRLPDVRASSFLYLSPSFDDWSLEDLQSFRDGQTRQAVIQAAVNPPSSLQTLHLVGQAELATFKNTTTPCLVVSLSDPLDTPRDGLFLPITQSQLKLISFAVRNVPLSKSVLLGINPLLVNRDKGFFDNVPWATWTVDPMKRNRDAAWNFVNSKFHMGKRDAYNVMMGKDWKGRSVSLGNLAMRLKYMLSLSPNKNQETVDLTTRILQLQVKELQMELAECEYFLAVAKQQLYEDEFVRLTTEKQVIQKSINDAELALQSPQSKSSLTSLLDQIARQSTNDGASAAPYRGATGYAPLLDSREDLEDAMLPYTSPFDLMREIIETQLQAQVMGVVLENNSLLTGTLALGGAVILQKKTPKKSVSIAGESLAVDDQDEDYGTGIKGGETYIVECAVDEAIGMALATKTTIQVEREIWDQARLAVLPVESNSSDYLLDALSRWQPTDEALSILVEGQAQNQSTIARASPLRIPRTTTSLFDSMFEARSPQNQRSPSLFPTDNPIRSLDEYDELDNAGKALTLLSLSNFNGVLPRPRVLRESQSDPLDPNPLDTLLLPLIDESVRRQFLIRAAEKRGDMDELLRLESEKSRRQQALELAEVARDAGDDQAAARWLQEADLYSNLRADVTQDEGSYSRFLDRDDDYEQNLRAIAKRNKKSAFGTLLDGIE